MKLRELFAKYGVDNSLTEEYLLCHFIQTKIWECVLSYILKDRLEFEPSLIFAYSMHWSWNAIPVLVCCQLIFKNLGPFKFYMTFVIYQSQVQCKIHACKLLWRTANAQQINSYRCIFAIFHKLWCPSNPFLCLFICQSVCLPVCLAGWLFICVSHTYPCIHPSIYPFFSLALFMRLPTCLPIWNLYLSHWLLFGHCCVCALMQGKVLQITLNCDVCVSVHR